MTRYRLGLLLLVGVVALGVAYYTGHVNPGAPYGSSSGLIPAGQRQPAPEFTGLDGWINSTPLHLSDLRSKVVVVDFWTFSCVNCIRTLPYERALYERYRGDGLVLVGMHSPEFDFEKVRGNVAAAVARSHITWPVALDSEMATWNAFSNQYWPAEYVIDQQGRIAYTNFGEGNYAQTDAAVASLLGVTAAPANGSATADMSQISPEIYVGSDRGSDWGLANGETYAVGGAATTYPDTTPTGADHVALSGTWSDHGQYITAVSAAHIRLRFHAHDLFFVAGAESGSAAVRVTLDGRPLALAQRGAAVAADGTVRVARNDLYHVLSNISGGDHLVDLLVPAGFQMFTFTFG